jgi:hypothetical protein
VKYSGRVAEGMRRTPGAKRKELEIIHVSTKHDILCKKNALTISKIKVGEEVTVINVSIIPYIQIFCICI